MKTAAIVTKVSLMNLLHTVPTGFSDGLDAWQKYVIGRALVVLFKRQTADEQEAHATNQHNNIGFAGCDAKAGSFAAKSFMKRGTLLDFQYDYWMKESATGYPRFVKYHRQLNEIAMEKAAIAAA